MATVTELQTRLDTLRKRRESLVSQVRQGDTTVTYDLTQTNAAIADLREQIAEADGSNKLRRYRIKTQQGRGW